MSFPVIPQNLSISAMRSSGYRDTAHALAELIDNSVQSGLESTNEVTQVEVICVEEAKSSSKRPSIAKIAVLDNAGGMSVETLRKALQFGNGSRLDRKNQSGIGKFGMGLPNSSISQGERVEVWSWQNGQVIYSYLDVDEIRRGELIEVPEPTSTTIPSKWLRLFMNGISKSGTLVVWSKLDRITWKQSTTLLRHVEFISGRIYRRFINSKRVQIRLSAYDNVETEPVSRWESFVRPNDPMYLMTGTNSPSPYDQKQAFEPFEATVRISVGFRENVHDVLVRASICKPEVRASGGGAPIGKHAKRNQGVSLLRADRELELSKSFEVVDHRERWWGIEVEFPPALDEIFGVTNNKQAATGFLRMILSDDADAENMSVVDYKRQLEQEGDPRLPMYAISEEIEKLLKSLRRAVAKMREGDTIASRVETLASTIEKIATESVKKRRERIGNTGLSDKQEDEPEEARTEKLTADIVDDGVETKEARNIAVDYVKRHTKFRIRHADLPTSAMFDVAASGGVIVLTFNTRHEIHSKVFSEFSKTDDINPLAREVLSMMIAWARLEDEAGSPRIRSNLEEVRESWGRMAKDFFEAEEG
ncbi:ATP-binding protein [Undibacterium sp. TJN25]|uniref:ATP-binding protein n=1 Tax=Undibacterium sp. TJN25 TaxID=3413056 RepID=UPI003BF267F6